MAIILAYITGGLLVLFGFLNYLFPARKKSLLIKLISDITSTINGIFILLATNNLLMLAGIISCAIGAARDVIFSKKDISKVFSSYWWAIGFSIVFLSSLFITYKGPISLLPAIGSVVSTLTLYFESKKMKIGAIIAQSMYVIYYSLLLSTTSILTVFSLLSSSTSLFGAIIGLAYLIYKEKQSKTLSKI